MREEENQTNVEFLDDLPTTEDELKLHKNIATTIKRIIDLTKDKNKKIIGLFGSWGSGKSTVIEILKGCKDEDTGKEKYKIFVFDSWSHKGDFLKRAFLLELARELEVEKEEYIKAENKDDITIETVLTRKVVNKTVDSKPLSKLNKSVKLITFLLILSIIVVAFSKIIEYLIVPFIPNHVIKFWENFEYKWLLGILFFSTIGFLAFLKRESIASIINNFINFYFLKKVDIIESHTTKEDLEFTNYDYENYLTYILDKANLNEKEPFIIVFDNLDRVDDETVLNTLSLIQLTNETLEKSNFKNVYFIIPIDKERLEKTIKTIIAGNSNNEPEKEKFAKDFLEKIFPYKINIPNIIHSEWRKFFSNRIRESFGSHINEDDISFIRRVFEKSISNSKEKNLTPREIKNFINSLVENYLYWENLENKPDIKLQSIYVALHNYFSDEFKKCIENFDNLKSCIEDSNSKCIFKDILKIAKEEFSEEEIKEALLKQYFKVEEIYVLFIDTSIQAIENENIEDLKGIVDLFEDRYKVEQLLDEVWEQKDEFRKDINLLLKLSKSLKEIGFYSLYEHKILKELEKIINNIDTLSKLKESNINEFAEILNNNSEIENLFIKKAVEIIITIPEGENNEA